MSTNAMLSATPYLGEIVSKAKHVVRNVGVHVLDVRVPSTVVDADFMKAAIRTVLEDLPMGIDNLHTGHDLERFGTGEQTRTVPIQRRYRPVIEVIERQGRPVQSLLREWITHGVEVDVLFIERDPTHTVVVYAWIYRNVMPESTGTDEVKRDSTPRESKAIVYRISLVGQHDDDWVETMRYAQEHLDDYVARHVLPNSTQLPIVKAASAWIGPDYRRVVEEGFTVYETLTPDGHGALLLELDKRSPTDSLGQIVSLIVFTDEQEEREWLEKHVDSNLGQLHRHFESVQPVWGGVQAAVFAKWDLPMIRNGAQNHEIAITLSVNLADARAYVDGLAHQLLSQLVLVHAGSGLSKSVVTRLTNQLERYLRNRFSDGLR